MGGWGRGSLLLQGLGPATGRPWQELRSSAGHSPQPAPGPPSSPAGPEAGGSGGPRGEGCDPPLPALSAIETTARLTVGGAGPLTAVLRVSH